MIYNLYIFDKHGTCLYHKEYSRPKVAQMNESEEHKLIYGMIYSLKSFAERIQVKEGKEGLHSFTTSAYKFNFYESASGFKFILNTDPRVGDLRDFLKRLYSEIFVVYFVRNGFCNLTEPIKSELFAEKLDDFLLKSDIV
eukprot:Clim_evm54s25 gene=Clim_evmTU54s25